MSKINTLFPNEIKKLKKEQAFCSLNLETGLFLGTNENEEYDASFGTKGV